jgi:hypothetical protein
MPLIPQQDILYLRWDGAHELVIDLIKEALESYPPVKIISMQTDVYNGGGNVYLVVESI